MRKVIQKHTHTLVHLHHQTKNTIDSTERHDSEKTTRCRKKENERKKKARKWMKEIVKWREWDMFVFVFVCVNVYRERERERERKQWSIAKEQFCNIMIPQRYALNILPYHGHSSVHTYAHTPRRHHRWIETKRLDLFFFLLFVLFHFISFRRFSLLVCAVGRSTRQI